MELTRNYKFGGQGGYYSFFITLARMAIWRLARNVHYPSSHRLPLGNINSDILEEELTRFVSVFYYINIEAQYSGNEKEVLMVLLGTKGQNEKLYLSICICTCIHAGICVSLNVYGHVLLGPQD